jgi:PAS domain S-box-containing protein
MSLKALVVDNNPVLLKAISLIVEKEGPCFVKTAEDGLQALEVLKEFTPDIVFTDLVMPLVDGELLCKIIRDNHDLQSICVVVVSAVPIEQTQRIIDDMDCDYCIVKSSLKELRIHIREVFKHYREKKKKSGKILPVSSSQYGFNDLDQTITTEILNEKRHLEEIVAYLSEGVVETNFQGKIVEINNAALEILGVKKEQVISSTIDSLQWGGHTSRVTDWLKNDLLGKQAKPLYITDQAPIFRKDKVLTATFLAIKGTSNFGIGIVRDVTRLYRAEEYKKNLDNALRLVKKMEAMSGMAGGVAHDFNNLLTILCGNIEMARVAFAEERIEKVDYLLAQAQQSAQATVELTTKISHFSPYGIITRQTHEVQDLVQTAINSFRSDWSITFSVEVEKELLYISIDHDQMVTALHNIFTNCAEAVGEGNILVRAEHVALSQHLLERGQYVPAGTYVKLSISDTGRGIEANNLIEIFDPYFSTKKRGIKKGMGLGLAVVYSTLRNHGGYVTVESVPDQGTTLYFYIPLSSYPRKGEGSCSTVSESSVVNLLLVEEDVQSRQVTKIMLEHLGIEVIDVSNRSEALAILSKHSERGAGFDVVLVDLGGKGPDEGISTCQKIREIAPDTPVIATCGSSMSPVMENFESSGFSNALPKPYTIDDLRHILSTVSS